MAVISKTPVATQSFFFGTVVPSEKYGLYQTTTDMPVKTSHDVSHCVKFHGGMIVILYMMHKMTLKMSVKQCIKYTKVNHF